MSKKIVQLGYGKMGKAVVEDMLKSGDFDEYVVADARPDMEDEISRLGDKRLRGTKLDVDDKEALMDLMDGAAVVVELLPIRYTMQVAEAAVEARANMVSSVFILD